MDWRKVVRWVVNIGLLVAAALAVPEWSGVLSVDQLAAVAAVVAVINKVLSVMRAISAGEALISKSF